MSEGTSSPDVAAQNPVDSNEYETLVGTMEQSIINIVDQLKDKVRGGEYELLIGDDTSARLPTLVLQRVFNHILESAQLPKLDVRFIQGGRSVTDYMVESQINKRLPPVLPSEGKKALLVTDFIANGGTLRQYSEFLGGLGLKFDVATLDMRETGEFYLYPF